MSKNATICDASEKCDTSANEVPLSPEVERVRRKLMRLMMVTLIITFLLVGVVLIAVVYKATRQPRQDSLAGQDSFAASTTPPPTTSVAHQLELDVQARIISHSLADGVMLLETRNLEAGHEFIFYDYRQGRVVSRLKVPLQSDEN